MHGEFIIAYIQHYTVYYQNTLGVNWFPTKRQGFVFNLSKQASETCIYPYSSNGLLEIIYTLLFATI